MTEEFPLQEETYRILGACFEVYNEMGCGFLEPVYQGRGKLRTPCDESEKTKSPSKHQPDEALEVDSS